ncbi:MAG: hypothetical protein M1823_002409 [Watsoniomyces obsoletus]|nr:MAG: hypothetical protein M1823_002409 [Watsoniomyces obsoletus]
MRLLPQLVVLFAAGRSIVTAASLPAQDKPDGGVRVKGLEKDRSLIGTNPIGYAASIMILPRIINKGIKKLKDRRQEKQHQQETQRRKEQERQELSKLDAETLHARCYEVVTSMHVELSVLQMHKLKSLTEDELKIVEGNWYDLTMMCRNRDWAINIVLENEEHTQRWERLITADEERRRAAREEEEGGEQVSKMVKDTGKMVMDAGRSFKANALSPAAWASTARGLATSPKWKAVPKFAPG